MRWHQGQLLFEGNRRVRCVHRNPSAIPQLISAQNFMASGASHDLVSETFSTPLMNLTFSTP